MKGASHSTRPTRPTVAVVEADRAFARALVDRLDRLGIAAARHDRLDIGSFVADGLICDTSDLPAAREWMQLQRHRIPIWLLADFVTAADLDLSTASSVRQRFVKPVDPEPIAIAVASVLRTASCQPSSTNPAIPLEPHLQRVARSDATVLLTGETGTGKTRLARALHDCSARRDGPFVVIGCGAISPDLAGSEIFGHVAGAFSDATSDTPGRLLAAEGGTLLLDDIDLAPPQLQTLLLRLLDDHTYEPVGSNETRVADVRIVTTTNADLPSLVNAGRFRADLLHRLHVIAHELPPLRKRSAEILPLAYNFLRELGDHRPLTSIAIEWLHQHAWPGNIRELQHTMQRAALLSNGPFITLPAQGMPTAAPRDSSDMLASALAANGWNRQRTADALGIDRTTLYRRMRRAGFPVGSRGGRAA